MRLASAAGGSIDGNPLPAEMAFERGDRRLGMEDGDTAVELLQLVVDGAQARQQRFKRLILV